MKRNSVLINKTHYKNLYILFVVLALVFITETIFAQASPEEGTRLITPKEGTPSKTGELVELNFQNVDVRVLLDIVSQFSGKSFLFRERDLQNRKITLISPQKYTIKEAYRIFEKILSVNDLRLIQEDNNIIRVVNVNEAKRSLTGLETGEQDGFGDDIVVTRIIKVNNTNINTVFRAINPFLSKTGTITRFDDTNSFIVKDTKENATRLAELVKIFDTKTDYQVRTYSLKYISVNKLKPVLEKVISKDNTTSKSQYFSYDTNKNTIIAVARNNEIKILENLIKRLDVSIRKSKKDGFQLKFISVQHLKVADVIGFVQRVLGATAPKKGGSIVIEGSIIIQLDDSNSFIIYGPNTSIAKIEQLVAEVDQEEENIVLEVVSILHSDANTVSKLVNQVFESRIAAASPLKLKIFTELGTNSLIILGTEKTINRVRNFIEKFDKPRTIADSQGFKFYFYPVQHAKATTIAGTLSSLLGNIAKQADVFQQTKSTDIQEVQKTDDKKTTKDNQTKSKKPATSTSTSTTTSIKENQPSIIADEDTNALIIYANQSQYTIIKNAIDDLDVVRPQVFVEALIIEVSLNKTLDLGLSYSGAVPRGGTDSPTGVTSINTPGNSSVKPLPPTVAGIASGPIGSGAVIGAFGDVFSYNDTDYVGYSAFIRALASDTEINILSNPKIVTVNNKKATINVGENRAFPKEIVRNTSNNTETQNFDYRDVGVKLEILPQINAGDYITMEITQENSSLSREIANATTTLKRTIQTEVIVKSGTTIALGGLVNDEKTAVERKVPCLGDIPLLGFLFKNNVTTSRKTNLVVFLTPTIIRTDTDQKAINKSTIEQIKTPIRNIDKNINIKIDSILGNDEQEEEINTKKSEEE